MLEGLDGLEGATTRDRLEHSLRAATLAERAGADEELVVAALCHDIGSAVPGRRHGPLAAELLRPHVRPGTAWAVSVHEDFVATHSARRVRRLRRYRHRLRRHYGLARRFADEWDVGARDRSIDALPLDHFRPALERVLSRRTPPRTWKRLLFDVVTRPLPRPFVRRAEPLLRRATGARPTR